MLTANETKIAASLGVSAAAFEAARDRNALNELNRELRVAMSAVGLVERQTPAMLSRGRHTVTFRGNAA